MADPLFRNPNPEEPFREPIAKLAKLITDRTPVVLGLEKIDKESPEYIGLSMMCTDEIDVYKRQRHGVHRAGNHGLLHGAAPVQASQKDYFCGCAQKCHRKDRKARSAEKVRG